MELVLVFLLILLNGVFSMSEIALISSKTSRLETAARNGSKGAQAALELARAPTRFLSTVQIGITFIGILTGIYSGETITLDLMAELNRVGGLQPYSEGLAISIVVVVITYFSLVLGELVPKRLALTHPETIAQLTARPMQLLSRLMAPFIWVLTVSGDLIISLLAVKASDNRVTEEEIKALVAEGTKTGEVKEIEQLMVEHVFRLGDRNAGSLMTPRPEMVFLDLHADAEKIRAAVLPDTHPIYPVYVEQPDNIVGMVTLKDLFLHLNDADFSLQHYLQPVRYLAEKVSAYHALGAFKRRNAWYAIVTDEFGATHGIITIKDIVTALMGEYADQDSHEMKIIPRGEGSWLVEGECPYPDFLAFFSLPDSRPADFNTVAGLVLRELQHIPVTGEKFQWAGFCFEILAMDKARIDHVLVSRYQAETP